MAGQCAYTKGYNAVRHMHSRPRRVCRQCAVDEHHNGHAEFHIFIGERKYWGKGIATKATTLMVEEGFRNGIKEIYLYVKKENQQAIAVYLKCGFQIVGDDGDNIKMAVRNYAE
jgi:RimJ/RimL family protein N-acetyltransferase